MYSAKAWFELWTSDDDEDELDGRIEELNAYIKATNWYGTEVEVHRHAFLYMLTILVSANHPAFLPTLYDDLLVRVAQRFPMSHGLIFRAR
jgi:hypothetical protein